jgi:hypothetical protein
MSETYKDQFGLPGSPKGITTERSEGVIPLLLYVLTPFFPPAARLLAKTAHRAAFSRSALSFSADQIGPAACCGIFIFHMSESGLPV